MRFFSRGLLHTGMALVMFCGPILAHGSTECSESDNYAVIAYYANTRLAVLVHLKEVQNLLNTPAPSENVYSTLPATARFLCDGKPVEIYIFNRRLLTAYTASLSSVFNVPASTIDLRGATPAAPGGSQPAAAAPAAKGFAPIATSTNILTTDQVIGYFLNDETYEKPLTKIADDVSAVDEQANQINMIALQYNDFLKELSGAPEYGTTETPLGVSSLESLVASWNLLLGGMQPRPTSITEASFGDWTSRADRLQTESGRINAKIQAYPIVDTLTNLKASLALLEDNYRGVKSERDAVKSALKNLQSLPTGDLTERRKAELRISLRAHYGASGTISEATLARIVETTGSKPLLATNINCDASLESQPGNVKRYCDANHAIKSELNETIKQLEISVADAAKGLDKLRKDIADVNKAEGDAMRGLNEVYGSYRAPVFYSANIFPLNLNLQGNSGNLFVYYTLSKVEQFNRYQIINDIAQPLSNCALAMSANTNTAGGFPTCTAAAMSTPPVPTATYSSTPFPPLQTVPAPASGTTGTPAPPVTATPYVEYSGSFQSHHFSHGTLITGIAYDSVANNSFSWVACSTSTSNPTGNLPSGTTGTCISPSVTNSNPNPPTYYQLVKSSQAPVAAVEGVDLFLLNRGRVQDMFPGHQKLTPGFFLGAAAYPLNHYFVGTTIEPERGFNVSAGAVFGSQTILPSSFAYTPGSYASVNPSIPTSTKFKTGFFIMIGFDTSLFGKIFNGSIFQSVLSIGTAGSPPAPAPAATPAPTQ